MDFSISNAAQIYMGQNAPEAELINISRNFQEKTCLLQLVEVSFLATCLI